MRYVVRIIGTLGVPFVFTRKRDAVAQARRLARTRGTEAGITCTLYDLVGAAFPVPWRRG